VSNYFCCHIGLEGLLYDLAITKFLVLIFMVIVFVYRVLGL